MNKTTALKLVATERPHPLAGKPVLESVLLRRGHKRTDLSRFEDPTWDLSPAVFRENAAVSNATVHFDRFTEASVERTLREFLYARLNFNIPGHRTRLPPASVRELFYRTRRFLEFIAAKNGACDLGQVDQATLDAYHGHLASDPQRGRRRIGYMLQVIADLHHFREHMPSDGIILLPWKGRPPFLVAGARDVRGENRTPRLPEDVIAALLKWSLKYITVFSADIFAARAELEALQENQKRLITEDSRFFGARRWKRQLDRLVAYLDRLSAAGRGIPTWTRAHKRRVRTDSVIGVATPTINAHLINLHIGINGLPGVMRRKATRRLVLDAIATIGTETGGMDTALTIDADTGQPWRPRFDAGSLCVEERMLQAACYIVCAYLTGMRDAEVQAMRAGCLDVQRSEDGLIERYRIRSTVYKDRGALGQSERWITIEPVAKAITVLERLTERIRHRRGDDTLWRMLGEARTSNDHISCEIVRQLNEFREHLNAQFGTPETPIVPSGTDGKPWRITTRQFRRTVAWHIANQPFGSVAGMIQFKHVGIAVFEGYAGSSRSGFRNEVERERALGQLDDVLSYFERHRAGEVLMGPAAARISSELQQAVDRLGPLPGHIADPACVRAMLAHVAKTLFVGVMNDCFFDPATALCLNGKTEAATPAMAQCRPDRCPNSCIARHHRPLWAKAIADGEELLKTRRLSPLQREAIEMDLKRYRNVLKHARTPDEPS
jgi:integrase